MKGIGPSFSLLVSVVIVVTLIVGALSITSHVLEQHGTIDRFANPINWPVYIGKSMAKAAGKKVFDEIENFLDDVSYIIPIDHLEIECNGWYKKCTAENPNAPQSPWSKLTVSEQDLNAMTYLKFDCATEKIEELRKEWARKNSYFAKKSKYEQYNLIKNACAATIVDKIKR